MPVAQLSRVFRPSGNKVDPGGLDAEVPQDIRQHHHILAGPVESPDEEVPKVVGKHLALPPP